MDYKPDDKIIASAMEALSSTEYRAKYDTSAKRLFVEKIFLAVIMKYCVEEYNDCSLQEIADCIEGTPSVDVEPVNRDLPRIKGSDTVDKTQDEGTFYYDIKFDALLPKSEIAKINTENKHERQSIGLIINLEPHGRYSPGYPVITRGGYYNARNISDQYGKEFTGEDFGHIKKVYSIWLCTDAPAYCANTVSAYEICERHLIGIGESEKIKEFHEPKSAYDIMATVMVRIGNPEETENPFMRFVGTLLSNTSSLSDKIKVISDIGISITEDIEREVEEMSSLGAAIEAKAREEGERTGRAEERKEMSGLMSFLLSNGRSEDALKASTDEAYLNKLLNDFRSGALAAN